MRTWSYFFSWYHDQDIQKLPHTPVVRPYDWSDPGWPGKEVQEMLGSGIDAFFEDVPVGRRSPIDLQTALRPTPVKCGLFLDTNSGFIPLWRKPLAIPANRQWVINTVLNWYQRPRTWELVQGRPVILTYTNSFIGTPALDDLMWSSLKAQFKAKYGAVPFLIVGDGWKGLRVPDGYTSYALGGTRFTRAGPLSHAGPGNIYVGRRSVKELVDSLNAAPPNSIAALIQSWNEWKENSQVERSVDEGDAYLEVIRQFQH